MQNKKVSLFVFAALLLIVQLACNVQANSARPDTYASVNGLYTASALTVEIVGTRPGFTVHPVLPQATLLINALIFTAPAPVSKCDAAAFLADVTYPDGSLVIRNNPFVKIWRIKNVGTCSWTPSYAMVFAGGNSMSYPSTVALSKNINPGEYIELPVTLTAPNKDGHYRGYWKLRNSSGSLFGIGAQADN